MSVVDLLTVRLTFTGGERLRPDTHWLRGAIAAQFPDSPLFHQHEGERLLYRFPRVQYRWDEAGALLVGLDEGARLLMQTEWVGRELRLGPAVVRVVDAVCEFRRHEIGLAPHLLRYRLAAPWLPFSQENYRRYQAMGEVDRGYERDRLARAGLLISLRGHGVEVDGRVFAAVEAVEPVTCRYKEVDLLGFFGRLLTNVDVPSGFALGRSVSHGYGWLVPEVVEVFEGGGSHE